MGVIKPLISKLNGRLVVVSNRGAYTIKETAEGIQATSSVSGLVSAIDPIISQEGGSWIAWGGRYGKEYETEGLSLPIPQNDNKYAFYEVLLTEEEVVSFYEGFSNSCLWPLCHNFIEKSVFDEQHWEAYKKVNKKYAEVLLKNASSQDWIWIHDYHLALLPGLLREKRPYSRISMFWHIPFPPSEIFAVMPWADKMIKGMLQAELIGFHSQRYVHNFLQAAEEIAGAEVDYLTGSIYWLDRKIKVIATPIGINWEEYEQLAAKTEAVKRADEIRKSVGGEYILLGVDRLDYTKGIRERLRAFEWLLENYPEYRGKVTFIQIAVPSRTNTPAYQNLKKEIDEIVGRINGAYTENYQVPVRYLFKPLSKLELVSHYLAADMALVTPLKDGLNLVAKEYIAANKNDLGVLLLSPFAGASSQLKEALRANPYSPSEIAKQIVCGLRMSKEEKKRHMLELLKVVREQDIHWWWRKFRQNWIRNSDPGKVYISTDTIREVLTHEPIARLVRKDS